MATDAQKTPLFEEHKELKAKMVNFGGWMMPVSYSSVLNEHEAVRQHAGLFDVSHMGEIFVTGPDARDYLQSMLSNNLEAVNIGRGQYTVMMNEQGGSVDDLIIYRIDQDEYLLCVNASNTQKDYDWLCQHKPAPSQCAITNASGAWSQLALQGPKSSQILTALLEEADQSKIKDLAYMGICSINWQGVALWCARTGYTGERGFELYIPNQIVNNLWKSLMDAGREHQLLPCGLGSRDTLRLESCYALYGNELTDAISPIEAGVSWAVKMNKPSFMGKSAATELQSSGSARELHAFVMTEPGIPRHGMKLYQSDREVGVVTSGSVLPSVGGSGGMALCQAGLKVGEDVFVDVRGKRKLAELRVRPLYSARIK